MIHVATMYAHISLIFSSESGACFDNMREYMVRFLARSSSPTQTRFKWNFLLSPFIIGFKEETINGYLESNFVKISMLPIVQSVGVCHLDSEKLHNARRMSLSEPSLYLLPCVSGVHFRLDNLNCHRRVASRHPPVIKMQKLSDFTLKVSITSLPFDVPHSSPLASFNSIWKGRLPIPIQNSGSDEECIIFRNIILRSSLPYSRLFTHRSVCTGIR